MRLRVPEPSQRRGNDKVTSMQQAKVMLHSAVKKFWGNDFVFDGKKQNQKTRKWKTADNAKVYQRRGPHESLCRLERAYQRRSS